MKPRVGLAFLTGALLFLGYYSSTPVAFHSGGVAECVGCHSMHEPKPGGSHLLVGTDASSTCLSCHMSSSDTGPSSYHVSTVDAKLTGTQLPLQRGPGGDFGWLKKNYTYGTSTEKGDTHGHNIVAADYGYLADPSNPTAPGGGSFSASKLQCSSCHDPHGKYRRTVGGTIETAATSGAIYASGSYFDGTDATRNEPKVFAATGENLSVGVYRLLAGAGYKQDALTTINYPGVPAAKVPSTYNRTEATSQTRAAYGVGTTTGHATWGKWCATCHPNMHSQGHYVHPIDQGMSSAMASLYSAYVKSGDLGGNPATSYQSLVPFIENTGDYLQLASHATNNNSQLGGPATGDQVSCLSCHRAHASGMMYAMRYDIEYEFMTKEGKYIGSDNPAITGGRAAQQHRGRLIADWQAAYYDRPASQFSAYQRVLCNKCHVKD